MISERKDIYDKIVRDCYASDPDLIEIYHTASGTGLDGCVSRELHDLRHMHESFTFFEILEDGKRAGYIGTEKVNGSHILSTFFVCMEFRNSEFLPRFWEHIKTNHFNNCPFYSGIYLKNERAVKFFKRCGGKALAATPKEDTVGLLFYFGD